MKKIVSIACLLITVITLAGCKRGLYMEDFKDVQWSCNDIELQFTYTSDNLEYALGTIEIGSENVEVVCVFTLYKNIEVYTKSDYEANSIDDIRTPLLIGSYSIEGDVATVKIIQDNLYNGECLDKVIELTKTPIE